MYVTLKRLKCKALPEISPTDDVYAIEGDSASLNCHVKQSIPNAQLRWKYSDEPKYLVPFKNPNMEIINTQEQIDAPTSGESSSQLVIKKVSRHDERNYICLAKNKAGTSQQIIKLFVEYKPAFVQNLKSNEVYFSWLLDESNGLSSEFMPVEIACMVEGRPVPLIQWYFKDELIHIDNVKYELSKEEANYSKLKVSPKSSDDFGEYKCKPENKHGHIEKSFNIKLASKPKSIPLIEVRSVYSTCVILEINSFGDELTNNEKNLPIDAYKLQWILANSTWSHSSEIIYFLTRKDLLSAKKVKAVIEPLTPDTEYIFRAASVNKAGIGMYTPDHKMIRIKTLPPFISKIVLAFIIIAVAILLLVCCTLFFYVFSKVADFILFRIKISKKYERLIVRV